MKISHLGLSEFFSRHLDLIDNILANCCLHPHTIYQIYQLVFSLTIATQVQATHYHLLPGPP